MAENCGAQLVHVKPHGALYNQAARERTLAEAIAAGVARWDRDLILVGLAGTPALDVYREAGFAVVAEAFADRRYEPDGSLRSREHPDALIRDPAEAGRQALSIAERGKVIACDGSPVAIDAQTICIHGDSPGAPQIASAVARALWQAGLLVRPLAVSDAAPRIASAAALQTCLSRMCDARRARRDYFVSAGVAVAGPCPTISSTVSTSLAPS